MKTIFRSALLSSGFAALMLVTALALPAMLMGCATTAGTASQQYINVAKPAADLLDQVTIAADAALKAGLLKGSDARNVLAILQTAKSALDAANVTAKTDPANAAVAITAIAVTLTQAQIVITKAVGGKS